MDSEEFFIKYKNDIEKKSGVYVLEHPMEYNEKRIFKVGYAHDSLYTRIRGYKTAYGPIHFKIHCAWHVPEGVFNKRLMTALQTERHLHDLLHSKIVMKKADTDIKDGEWFYDIKQILYAVLRTRASQIAEVENVEDLFIYVSDEVGKLTRSKAKTVPNINPDEQSSKYKGITMRAPSKRNVPSKNFSPDEYEVGDNKSREKQKVKYVARVKKV